MIVIPRTKAARIFRSRNGSNRTRSLIGEMGAFAEARYFAWETVETRQEFPVKGHSLSAEQILAPNQQIARVPCRPAPSHPLTSSHPARALPVERLLLRAAPDFLCALPAAAWRAPGHDGFDELHLVRGTGKVGAQLRGLRPSGR
jgi:hypothetical protein